MRRLLFVTFLTLLAATTPVRAQVAPETRSVPGRLEATFPVMSATGTTDWFLVRQLGIKTHILTVMVTGAPSAISVSLQCSNDGGATATSTIGTMTTTTGAAVSGDATCTHIRVNWASVTGGTTVRVYPVYTGIGEGSGSAAAGTVAISQTTTENDVNLTDGTDTAQVTATSGGSLQVECTSGCAGGGTTFDLDSGAGTQNVSGASLRIEASGGSIPLTAGAGAVAAGTLRVTHASDDPVNASLDNIEADIDTLVSNQSQDATHDNVFLATGPQQMCAASDQDGLALPNAVSAEGDAARVTCSLYGIAYVMAVNEDGTKTPYVDEDVASAAADLLVKVGGIRDDTLDARSGTEGDWEMFHLNASGALWTIDVNSAASLTALQLIDNLTTDPCTSTAKTFIPIDIVTATTTELTAALAGASTHYYICSIALVTAGANNVAIVDDDTDNCTSVTSGVLGGLTAAEGFNLAANGGLTLGNGFSAVARTVGTNRVLCAVTSAAVQLSGGITVVAAP